MNADRQGFLARVMELPLHRPRGAVVLAALLLLLAVASLLRVHLVTDLNEAVRTPAARTFERVTKVFGLAQSDTLLIEADGPGRERDLLATAAAIERDLRGTNLFETVEHGLPVGTERVLERLTLPYGLLYLDPKELRRLLTPEGMRERLAKQAELLALPGLGRQDTAAEEDPLGLRFPILRRLIALSGGYRFAPGSTDFLSADGRALLVTLQGKEPASSSGASRRIVAAIRTAVDRALRIPRAHGLTVQAAGGYQLAEESERIVRRDLIGSLSASIVLAAVLLAIGLAMRMRHVLLLCIPTLWATAVGVGVFVLFHPHVSALSFGGSAILVGLGIDFTIHLAAAALGERRRGRPPLAAIRAAIHETRGRMTLAALTSIAAFLSFLTSRQVFLQDMGMLTVCGLSACLFGAFLLLPPILSWVFARDPHVGEREGRTLGLLRLAHGAARRPRRTLLVVGALSAAAIAALVTDPPRLEQDLRNIHARNSAPLAAQRHIDEIFGGSQEPLLLLIDGSDENDVVGACQRLAASLERLLDDGTLTSVSSIAALVPPRSRQERSLAILAEQDPRAEAERLRTALDEAGFDSASFSTTIHTFEKALALRDPITVPRLAEAGLAPLAERFVRRRGDRWHALLVMKPREELWDAERRSAVLGDVHAAIARAGVDGSLTGLYPVSAESAAQVSADFQRVSFLTLGAILAVLVLRFRRPGRVLLVLVPSAIGALWTAGLLSATEVHLNLMNLGVLPMVLGIGIDDGIHIVSHYLENPRGGIAPVFRDTGVGVVFTSLTTMVTFGSLAFSENRGLASVGALSFFGVGACLLVTLLLLPALLQLMRKPDGDGGN